MSKRYDERLGSKHRKGSRFGRESIVAPRLRTDPCVIRDGVISLTALPVLMTSVAGQRSFVAGLQAALFEALQLRGNVDGIEDILPQRAVYNFEHCFGWRLACQLRSVLQPRLMLVYAVRLVLAERSGRQLESDPILMRRHYLSVPDDLDIFD